jgi:hypothetical protein
VDQDPILSHWPKGTKLFIPLQRDGVVTDRKKRPWGWKALGVYHFWYGWEQFEKTAEGKVT